LPKLIFPHLSLARYCERVAARRKKPVIHIARLRRVDAKSILSENASTRLSTFAAELASFGEVERCEIRGLKRAA